MRTQADIVARVLRPVEIDFLGVQRAALMSTLDYSHARQFLPPDTTPKAWGPVPTEDDIRAQAVGYLEFAVGKALGHHGLSAERSVHYYTAWLWLLGVLPADWDDVPYAQYGVPKLAAAAAALGVALPAPDKEARVMLDRMGRGEPCTPGCEEGCAA